MFGWPPRPPPLPLPPPNAASATAPKAPEGPTRSLLPSGSAVAFASSDATPSASPRRNRWSKTARLKPSTWAFPSCSRREAPSSRAVTFERSIRSISDREGEGGDAELVPRVREAASEVEMEEGEADAEGEGEDFSPCSSLRQSIALCTAPRSSIALATPGSCDRLTSAARAGREEAEELEPSPSPSSVALRSSGGSSLADAARSLSCPAASPVKPSMSLQASRRISRRCLSSRNSMSSSSSSTSEEEEAAAAAGCCSLESAAAASSFFGGGAADASALVISLSLFFLQERRQLRAALAASYARDRRLFSCLLLAFLLVADAEERWRELLESRSLLAKRRSLMKERVIFLRTRNVFREKKNSRDLHLNSRQITCSFTLFPSLPLPPRAGILLSAPALSLQLRSVASCSALQKMPSAMLRARCAPVSTARASTSSAAPAPRVAAAAVPLRRSPIVARAAAADFELSPGSPPADLIIVTGDAPSAGAKVLEKKRSRRFKELKAKVRVEMRRKKKNMRLVSRAESRLSRLLLALSNSVEGSHWTR